MTKDKVLDEELMVFKEVMDRENIVVNFYDELSDAISHVQSITSKGDIILLEVVKEWIMEPKLF